MVTNSYSFKLSILVTLATDIILLVFMLVGLLRVRAHDGCMLKLGPFLWKQVGGKTLHGVNPQLADVRFRSEGRHLVLTRHGC
jgi:hypothetical protein